MAGLFKTAEIFQERSHFRMTAAEFGLEGGEAWGLGLKRAGGRGAGGGVGEEGGYLSQSRHYLYQCY